ncbi:hypothetical protein GC163_23180 [bacterium]|nr:hypothetical protein [bacterium]
MQRQLKSALRFPGHIDVSGVVQSSFNTLVKAHGTDGWPEAVLVNVVKPYHRVTANLPINNATAAQLSECFRNSGAQGQVVDKAVRFWLHAMKEAKQQFSPFFSMH